MIKLVVTDVDGTIVPKDEILRPQMVKLAQRLRQSGVVYTIATGRVHSQAADYIQQLGLENTPFVACNGGAIVRHGEVLSKLTIPLGPLRQVVAVAEALEMSVLYSVDGVERACHLTDYVCQQQKDFGRYEEIAPFTEEMWQSGVIEKIIFMAKVRDGSLDAVEALCRRLPEEYGYKRYANKGPGGAAPGFHQGKGCGAAGRMLGIPMKQVMAVGDDLNDLGMLRAAGIGVAVGNAQEPAKEAADYVAEGACYEGVIEACERFCFRKEGD